MSKDKLMLVGLGILIGIVASPQIMRLPGVSKIPTL
jgi:hypothetical protein